MINVLIADDEEKVCQLIYNLIDWSGKGMQVTGFAHNGIEALEKLDELCPEIIITDIRMPGYDGLELIERAREIRDDLEFIIISGHRHFEYAKSAIRFGVEDYLLKPVNEKELNETLDKIIRKRNFRADRQKREELLLKQAGNDRRTLRQNLFREVIAQQENAQRLETINSQYHYHLSDGLFQIIVITFDLGCEQDYGDSRQVLRNKITQIVQAQLSGICHDLEVYPADSRMICLMNFSEADSKMIRKAQKSILDELMVQRNIFGDINFSVGCGKQTGDAERLYESWISAGVAADERLTERENNFFENVIIQDCEKEVRDCLVGWNREIEQALEVMDRGKTEQAFTEFTEKVQRIAGLSGYDLRRAAGEAYTIYLIMLQKYDLTMEEKEKKGAEFQLVLERCGTAAELFAYARQQVLQLFDHITEERKQQSARPIRNAMQYIQEHHAETLTLDEVSQVAGFNPTYFSTLFKKETGKNFQEYILEVRMKKAKDLLKETDLSVAVICEEVGYSDQKHFTKTFKKIAGINPNQYRKIYS